VTQVWVWDDRPGPRGNFSSPFAASFPCLPLAPGHYETPKGQIKYSYRSHLLVPYFLRTTLVI